MKSRGINKDFTAAGGDALATVIFKSEKISGAFLKELDNLTGGQLSSVISSGEFKGEKGETAVLRYSVGQGKKRKAIDCRRR